VPIPAFFSPGEYPDIGLTILGFARTDGTATATWYTVAYHCCGRQADMHHTVVQHRRYNTRGTMCISCTRKRHHAMKRLEAERRPPDDGVGPARPSPAQLPRGVASAGVAWPRPASLGAPTIWGAQL
jgi:hypothetical protein